MSLTRKWWSPFMVVLTVALPAHGASNEVLADEEESIGVSVLKWAGGQLGGKVGGLVSSQLLGVIGLSSDPNASVMRELAQVEAQLGQIHQQLDGLSQQLAGGLQQIGCEVQGGTYATLLSNYEKDIRGVQNYARLAKELADASYRGDPKNALMVADNQQTIRTYASSLDGIGIHDRIHDFALGGGAGGATGAVQMFSDKLRNCSKFVNTDRLARIKTQFDWLASLQVASCSLVVNYWTDEAKRAGTDPDASPDLQDAASKCHQYSQDLLAKAITSNLPDDQTVYEISSGLLWKWGDFANGRERCWGGRCPDHDPSCGRGMAEPPCRQSPAPWSSSGPFTHKAIPAELSHDDCRSFCVGDGFNIFVVQLEKKLYGDAASNLRGVSSDWRMPKDPEFRSFRDVPGCSNSNDSLTLKRCLRDKGWSDANGVVIGGEGGGFYIWVQSPYATSQDRVTAASFLLCMTGTGDPFQTNQPENVCGVLFVRPAAANDRFLW